MTFQESELYKKALLEYQKEKYENLLNPKNIITSGDSVYLFYDVKEEVLDDYLQVLIHFKNVQYSDLEEDFPKHLWYELPRKSSFDFMWKKYPCILLWFDWEIDTMEKNRIPRF